MSLPRNYQDSRGSVYGKSEPDTIGRIQYKSGRFLRTSTDSGTGTINGSSHTPVRLESAYNCDNNINIPDLAIVACSQPVPSSLLAECQQSCGSLFSVVSAPPLPLAELDIKQIDAGGLQNGVTFVEKIGGSVKHTHTGQFSTTSIDGNSSAAISLRPATLPVDPSYLTTQQSRTLHASLLEHQISEIEEDDNENLLTVSSITARPLIAKSREIRSSHAIRSKGGRSHTKCNTVRKTCEPGTNKCARTSSQSSVSAEPPDGGYGWLIVFGAFSVQFWVAGLVKSYGVLFVEIMETFPNSTAAVASWIPAILSALCLALAPLSSALCTKYSCRSVVFVGGLFCALGLTLSYFATSLIHLLLTFGVLTGIGGGLSTTPGIVIVSQYFDKHRALANGICVSGTAAGSFILPVLIKHLAEEFGFHGTILILGGCMLHVCMSATLYRPLEDYYNDIEKAADVEEDATRPLNINNEMLTNSTYLNTCEDNMNTKFIEHLFLEESKNRLNDYLSNSNKNDIGNDRSSAQESDDEIKDVIGETTFIKPMKKVRSSGILHSVEDLSTDSTWVYRKHSGTDSNRGSRRRRNVFANDEIISKIQAHLEKPLSPPKVVTRGLSKSMEIPTPVSNFTELKGVKIDSIVRENSIKSGICEEEENDEVTPLTCCERIEIYLDLSLLKDYTFILMCLSVTLMSVGCPYMLYFLPAHALSIGCNKSMAGYLVAISAVLDLFGRLGLGWLCDLQLFDRRKTYIFCILGAGIAVLTIPFEHKVYQVGISAGIYGFCLGSWYVLVPVLLADIFGTDRISSSYGLVRMFQSIGAISVPPLAGYLRDLSGSFEICFYCMGSCMIMGCVPLLVWSLLEHREQQRLDAENTINDPDSIKS